MGRSEAVWAGMLFHLSPPCGCKGGAFSHACYRVGALSIAECMDCQATFAAKKDSPEAVAFIAGDSP